MEPLFSNWWIWWSVRNEMEEKKGTTNIFPQTNSTIFREIVSSYYYFLKSTCKFLIIHSICNLWKPLLLSCWHSAIHVFTSIPEYLNDFGLSFGDCWVFCWMVAANFGQLSSTIQQCTSWNASFFFEGLQTFSLLVPIHATEMLGWMIEENAT